MTKQLLKPKKQTARKRGAKAARAGDIVINGSVRIPSWVTDVDSFRHWACSDAFPERGRFSWLADYLHVEVYSELLEHLSDAEIERMRTKAFEPIRRSRSDSPNGDADGRHAGDIVIDELVRIPWWVRDHDSFRRWAFSDDFPSRGQLFYLNGVLWVDLSMETLIHNQIKGIFAVVVGSIVLLEVLGKYLGDRMTLAHVAAGLSCEPDGMYISNEAFDSGRAMLKEGDKSLEILGTPDMALEVSSKTSVPKDTGLLKELYAKAGIAEYWLVDSTIEAPELVIMRLVTGKYVTARKRDGCVKSNVFGRSFRLTCKKDAKGVSHFNLETK